MNDVNHTGINSSLRLYADDTTQYASDLCPPVQYSLNQDIHTLCGWFNENFLHIDGAKTKAMILGKSSYDLRIANDTIKVEDTLKILGVNWTMASPSSRMSQKCSRKLMIAALLRLKRMVPVEIVMKLYNAYILPHLEYCSPILIGISKPLKNKLEHANHYGLRTLINLVNDVSYDSVVNLASMRSLEQRRIELNYRRLTNCYIVFLPYTMHIVNYSRVIFFYYYF